MCGFLPLSLGPLLPQTSTHGCEQRIKIDRFPEDAEILSLYEIAGIAGDHNNRNLSGVSASRDLLLYKNTVETG